MSRLWFVALAPGAAASFALVHGMLGHSLWPSVALFCLSGLLACVAACIDAAVESAKHEAELDSKADDERLSALESKVEHLQKKDALNALG